MAPPLKVLIPIFHGFNTLDLNGPLEVLKNTGLPEKTFEVHIAAAAELTKAAEGVQIQRDLDIMDLLDPSYGRRVDVKISDFDAMIVPGSPQWAIDAVLNSKDGGGGFLTLIRKFGNFETETKPRWLISICTGAEFLAPLGILAGKPATTHWAALTKLSALGDTYAAEYNAPKIDVKRKRFVYAGTAEYGVKVATSGGISCGIDCVLWYVSQVVNLESAKTVAHFMDYPWGFTDVDYTQGYEV